MKITRADRTFDVVDDPQTAAWRFWQDHFSEDWEAASFDVLNEYLQPDKDFIDVGAWVGPLTLWASPLCRQVLAAEPDPVAQEVLWENINRNNLKNVTVFPGAVSDHIGTALLDCKDSWGNSMSSLTDRGGKKVEVPTTTLADLGWLSPALIKIDTEGGEGKILPDAVEFGCPILLGIHWPWLSWEDAQVVRGILGSSYKIEYLDSSPDFPTVLVLP